MLPLKQAIRTLVVDDSCVALSAICSFLRTIPAVRVIGTASDGLKAIELANSLRPELVLLDIQMPLMNGFELAIRLNRDLPQTRVIAVTLHDSQAVRRACAEHGIDGFVSKLRLEEDLLTILPTLFNAEKEFWGARGTAYASSHSACR